MVDNPYFIDISKTEENLVELWVVVNRVGVNPVGDTERRQVTDVVEVHQFRVVGHADRMGKPAANQTLSERRARTIKSYLVAKGIKPGVIVTNGVGDSQPVVECDDGLAKAEKVACLAPNRRVELTVKLK